jgi:transposase
VTTVTVLSGAERRRRWTTVEKFRIVEESLAPGASVIEVARRHDVHPNLVTVWRRQARQGQLSGEAMPALVPVEISSAPAPIPIGASQPVSSSPAQHRAGIIEIELGSGCRVRVDRDVDGEALQRVLKLLRRR